MGLVKKDLMVSCSKVQMCSGHSAGSEAVIHSMHDLFDGEESEAVDCLSSAATN